MKSVNGIDGIAQKGSTQVSAQAVPKQSKVYHNRKLGYEFRLNGWVQAFHGLEGPIFELHRRLSVLRQSRRPPTKN